MLSPSLIFLPGIVPNLLSSTPISYLEIVMKIPQLSLSLDGNQTLASEHWQNTKHHLCCCAISNWQYRGCQLEMTSLSINLGQLETMDAISCFTRGGGVPELWC